MPCCFHSVQFPVPRSSEWCAQQALAKSLRNMTRNCLPTFQPLSSHVRHRQFTKLRAVSSKHFSVQTHFHPTHFASMFFAPKRSIQITFSQNLFPKCTSKPFSPKTTIPQRLSDQRERVPALQTPPKFHEMTPKENNGGGSRKNNAKFWAPHPSSLNQGPPFGTPPSRLYLLRPQFLGPHPVGDPP